MPEPENFNLYEDIAPVFQYGMDRLKRLQEETRGATADQHWQNQHKAIVAHELADLRMRHYVFRNIYLYHSIEDMERILREQAASGDGDSRFYGWSIIPQTYEIVNSVVRDGYVHVYHAVESLFRTFNAHAKNEAYGRLGANPRNSINFVNVFKRDFGFDLSIEGPPIPRRTSNRKQKKAAKASMRPGLNLMPRLFQKLYPRLDKLRAISNCVKHDGGIPTKNKNKDLYKHLPYLPERQLLAIDHKEFLKDFEYVIQFVAQFLNFYDDLMEYVLLQRDLDTGADLADTDAARRRFEALKLQLQGMAAVFREGRFGEIVTFMEDYVTQKRELEYFPIDPLHSNSPELGLRPDSSDANASSIIG